MFNRPVDERLTEWVNHRRLLDESKDPLQDVWDFWNHAPFTPHNNHVDPYFQRSWPTPWQIIEENKYDDFTKALMISWTLKLTNKFHHSKIEIKTMIDSAHNRAYNLVYINDTVVLNYNDNGPVDATTVLDSLRIENLIEVLRP